MSSIGGLIGGIMAAGIITVIICLGLAVVLYVFEALGLYTIAKRRGVQYAWLSWIPVGNLWVIGSLADGKYHLDGKKDFYYRHILLWGGIGAFVLSFLPVIGWMISVALLVFEFMALYQVYRTLVPNSATTMLVLSIIFTVTIPFFIFCNRYKENGWDIRNTQNN